MAAHPVVEVMMVKQKRDDIVSEARQKVPSVARLPGWLGCLRLLVQSGVRLLDSRKMYVLSLAARARLYRRRFLQVNTSTYFAAY